MDKDLSVLFLGDVVPYKPAKFKNEYKIVFNLECPITTGGKPAKGKINLQVDENYLRDIFGNNLLIASLANNHILDFGQEGLESTLKSLKETDVLWFGLNKDDGENIQPLILDIGNLKVALFAAVCKSTSPVVELDNNIHVGTLIEEDVIRAVSKTRGLVDRVILYLHWGIEESSYPSEENIFMARRFIDSGVDILIGSHAHAPQPIEKYKDGIIAYNLGNFLMPAMNDIPAYYDENATTNSTYFKNIMMWNRISWGFLINLETKNYKIIKYIHLYNRVFHLPFTPLDKYCRLDYEDLKDRYRHILDRHIKRRAVLRKYRYFISKPYIPERIKKSFKRTHSK